MVNQIEFWEGIALGSPGPGRAISSIIHDRCHELFIKHDIPNYFATQVLEISNRKNFPEFIKEMYELGFKIESSKSTILTLDLMLNTEFFLKHRLGAVLGQSQGKGSFSINIYSLNKDLIETTSKVIGKYFGKVDNTGQAYGLISTSAGLDFAGLGKVHSEFIPENYNVEVNEAYPEICGWLNSKSPMGRICIFDGPAGTGKTHLLRALTSANPNALFVMIPSGMAGSLANPNFLPLLLAYSEGGSEVVLVLEDADNALVKRDGYNNDTISAILNLTDGIFGLSLNLRLIATTNANHIEFDPAVIRPGRLFKRINIGPLEHMQARAVAARLAKGLEDHVKSSMTLAEIYALSGNANFKPVSTKKSMGF